MSMSKLNFILELTHPNRLLCGATWEGRPLIHVVCAHVYALQFTYHATPTLNLPLLDLVTTLNFILGGAHPLSTIPSICTYTGGSRIPSYYSLSDRTWSPLDFKGTLAVILSGAKAGMLFLYLNSWQTSHGRANKASVPGPCWWANLLGMSVF